jgi:hypothetical protein
MGVRGEKIHPASRCAEIRAVHRGSSDDKEKAASDFARAKELGYEPEDE